MISEIRPLIAGAALHLSFLPPAGALLWRVLRKGSGVFSGHDDATALLVYEGRDTSVLDAMPGLVNEAPMAYCAFYFDGDDWTPSAVVSGTPLATYQDRSTDVQMLVRDRLEEGFKVEYARQEFVTPGRMGLQVVTAPPMVDKVEPPFITVFMESSSSSGTALGEQIEPDYLESDGEWIESEGRLEDVSLEITGWSLNSDERKNMRKAIRRILMVNMPVFDAAGMVLINFTARDQEFLNGEFGANTFVTTYSFSCQAPAIVSSAAMAVRDVSVTAAVTGATSIN